MTNASSVAYLPNYRTEMALARNRAVPERNLLVAMLQRAMLDYYGSRKVEKDNAREWIFSSESGHEIFSFCWICVQLDLEPEVVRTQISRLESDNNVVSQQWCAMRRMA